MSALPEAPAPSSLPEEVRSAFDYTPTALTGYLAGVAVATALFWSVTPAIILVPWLAAFAAMALVRVLLLRRFRRALAKGDVDWPRWREIGRAHV